MKQKKQLAIMLTVLLTLAVGFGLWQWFSLHSKELPQNIVAGNARLEMGRIDVATLYSGRVQSVAVHEGDNVTAGAELARIEATQVKAQLEVAEAAKQRVLATVAAQQQKFDVAQIDYRNTLDLHHHALVSPSELAKRSAQMKGEHAGIDAARAAVAEADAQIKRMKDMDKDMVLRAPINGQVEYRLAEPGEVIGAGGRVVSLLDPSNISMSVFLPVRTIVTLSVGADARICVDGLDARFPAHIAFISAQAQFTPKYVETQNERDKLMYRVKLVIPPEIALKYRHLLKGGLTGIGYVNTDRNVNFPPELSVKLPRE